jgi:hypothetical protein
LKVFFNEKYKKRIVIHYVADNLAGTQRPKNKDDLTAARRSGP